MAGRNHLKEEKSRSSSPSHIFIQQNPYSCPRGGSKLVSSHARKFQSAGKRRRQEVLAHQGAEYARSLVGWRAASSTPVSLKESPTSSSTEGKMVLGMKVSALQDASIAMVVGESPGQQDGGKNEGDKGSKMTLNVGGGLRMDPFNAFPTSNSKTVNMMVDYHIHVWGPHMSGFFDSCMGYNTQLDLCWPIAMQDEMLFDATIAVSRSAWLISNGCSAADDSFMLYHRGLALAKLQQRVSFTAPCAEVEVIFTIGRMLSIAYMTNERDAFNLHIEAYQALVEQYIHANPGTDISRINVNRLRCWKAVHAYRTERDLVRDPSLQGSPSQLSSETQSRQSISPQPETSKQKEKLTPTSPFSYATLSPGTIYWISILNKLLVQQDSAHPWSRAVTARELASLSDQICQVLVWEDLSAVESQLCCALVAFCLQLKCHNNTPETTDHSESQAELPDEQDLSEYITSPSVPPLNEMAQTFLNKRLSGLSGNSDLRIIVAWSALVMGSYLLQHIDGYVRRKGHIILVSLDLALQAATGQQSNVQGETYINNGWRILEAHLKEPMGLFWHEELAGRWKHDWITTIARQQRWAATGLWIIGAPKTLHADGRPGGSEKVDVVEHLLLKDARDTLPFVDRSPASVGSIYPGL
ncbi:hypothetical protein LTR84_004154 [Exophiala bonariae]|uniref:Transcription factor domain-containing protein n=1 Tax=Exophiala bonariae TaxID=1690606 RepID=A0AAV9N5S2_9EURO|nr:hypothetical protein LTR84_004154 [Exophiala bonariae]